MNKTTPLLIALLGMFLTGCPANNGSSSGGTTVPNNSGGSGANGALRIVSGSENKTLEPILQRWARENNVAVTLDYRGSVDIMLLLQSGNVDADAVWPANGIWIALGDRKKLVKNEQSIFYSPVVLGVKKSVAEKLGWVGKPVRVDDILAAAEAGKLRFMMTSATQSNSGASAYLGYLSAFAGKPQVLTSADLQKPVVQTKIKRILGSVNRSSGSSGFLKDLFLQKYDDYDAMVNYESVVIETNQALAQNNREPLYAVYPVDGLAIADSPLGYVDKGDAAKQKQFQELQDYLLSAPVQQEIVAQGRRVGPVGEKMAGANLAVFNPAWGINTSTFLNQIRYPRREVIAQALDLYQTAFRKPSFTVFCLDFSRSMAGEREQDLKSSMRTILDQSRSRQSLLQASPRDTTVVITFAGSLINEYTVKGNDPAAFEQLWSKINAEELAGGTDIYSPVVRAYEIIAQRQKDVESAFPAVILMTDGESNTGKNFADVEAAKRSLNRDVPVFGIKFGDASSDQLNQIADFTSGRVFNADQNLTTAFREAKGYN